MYLFCIEVPEEMGGNKGIIYNAYTMPINCYDTNIFI